MARDQQGKVTRMSCCGSVPASLWSYVTAIGETCTDRSVHGFPASSSTGICTYVAHSEGGIWPEIAGITNSTSEENNFDGIAELSFRSDQDRTTWFRAAGILMDEEHNLFRKAIGYNTSPGNSITCVDGRSRLEIRMACFRGVYGENESS